MAQLLEPPAAAIAGAAGVEHHAQRVQDPRVLDLRELPQRRGEERVPGGLLVALPGEGRVAQRLERGARHVGGEVGEEGEDGGDDRGGAREEDEGALVELVAGDEVADEPEA